MSRGPGHIQQQIIDSIGLHGSVTAITVAHWSSDVHYENDTEPTRSQVESARRALIRLERDGVLESELDDDPCVGRGRRRWYRLADVDDSADDDGYAEWAARNPPGPLPGAS
jgi:hypothetical protein